MLRIVHFQRRPAFGQVSIERLFTDIRRHLPDNLHCEQFVCPRLSQGLLPRLSNMRAAARRQGEVNHVLGDVHYLTLGLNPRRTALTIHDCASLERLRGLKRIVFKWFWFDVPIRRAAIVTTVSEATKREIVKYTGGDPERIRVIHNCVCGDCRPSSRPFNEAHPTILQVGTGYNKNVERVVRALDGIPCSLNIIGKLSKEQEVLLMQHRIRFTNLPRASDVEMMAAYHDCDLVLFASTYEGFGLPIVEANAIGRPVITSDRLSMPEVAGDAALLVNPLDVGEIRASVLRIIADPVLRSRLVAAGFENVKRFQPAAVASKYACLYRELAA